MFSVKKPHTSPLGEVKISSAPQNAYFNSRTSGLALKYVFQGQENYLIGGEKVALGSGQFMILRDGQEYEAFTAMRGANTHGVCIDLDPERLFSIYPDFYKQELLFDLPFQGFHFLALSQKLHFCSKSTDLWLEDLTWDGLLGEIYQDLRMFTESVMNVQPLIGSKVKKISTQKDLLAKLYREKDFIYENFNRPLRLETISRHTGISQYHFMRLFQICFQHSPYELQLELRMENALKLINETEMPLSAIAQELGYGDLPAFSNQFKQYYQQSPSQIRKNL